MSEGRVIKLKGPDMKLREIKLYEDSIDGKNAEIGTFLVPGWILPETLMIDFFNKGWRILRSDDIEGGQRFFTLYKNT